MFNAKNLSLLPTFYPLAENAILPTRATPQSAGFDLCALSSVTVAGCCGNYLVPTGVGVHIPVGYYGRIACRSGLAVREHLTVSAGVIDIDYEGKPLGVVVSCTRIGHSYTIRAGERFAQLIIEKCYDGTAMYTDATPSPRFSEHSGFGSTGKDASTTPTPTPTPATDFAQDRLDYYQRKRSQQKLSIEAADDPGTFKFVYGCVDSAPK